MKHLIVTLSVLVPVLTDAEPVTRFAFGSCCKENRAAPIFASVTKFKPQVWIWMGDNIYGDTTDMAVMEKKYAKLKARPGYAALSESCTVIGTWDDHDYGKDNAGKEYPAREASQQRFLDFFGVAADSPRRKQEGVYTSHTFGDGDQRVKVILLDTRYHRDAPGPNGDILGEAQWAWLERELTDSSAAVHLLVSSIQLVPADHRFEKWANFPMAHKRLYDLLSRKDVPPVTVLSGDRHLAEITAEKTALPYPFYDVTSSGLNANPGGSPNEANRRRIGKNFRGTNFGTLKIDWSASPPLLRFAIRNEQGEAVRELKIHQRHSP